MKKYLAILMIAFLLSACNRGEQVSEKSRVYRKRQDGYYYDLGPLYGANRVPTSGDSFEVLAGSYAKDKEHVFYEYHRLPGADPATFEVLADYYGKDKNYVFFQEDLIDGANPAAFKVLTLFSGKDDKHIFYTYRVVEQADINSFYIREKDWPLDGVLVDKDHVFVFDEEHDRFYPSVINLDKDTVEYVEGVYVPLLKDKHGVYWHNSKLPIDVSSFHEVSPCCWEDKNEKYCRTCEGDEPPVLFDTKGNVWK